MTRTLLTLAVVAAVATPAHAQVVVQGAGMTPCSAINDYYRKYPASAAIMDATVFSWASGFMSSGNLARQVQGKASRDLGVMTMEQQTAALRRWCRARPTKTLLDAVFELFALFPLNDDAAVVSQDTFK